MSYKIILCCWSGPLQSAKVSVAQVNGNLRIVHTCYAYDHDGTLAARIGFPDAGCIPEVKL